LRWRWRGRLEARMHNARRCSFACPFARGRSKRPLPTTAAPAAAAAAAAAAADADTATIARFAADAAVLAPLGVQGAAKE
jgi:hypothetical protein